MAETTERSRAVALLGICLFFSYLLPYHFLPFSTFYNEWLAVLGVVIAVAYVAIEKNVTVNIPWICMLPLGLAVFIGVQTFFGEPTAYGDAILAVGYFLIVAIAISLGASIAAVQSTGAHRLVFALALAHLFAALVSLFIACLQFLAVEAMLDPFVMLMEHKPGVAIRPFANIAQPNHLALLFCMAIASVWWLYQKGLLKARLAISTVLALVWGIVITQSRIGWLILPGAAVMIWLFGHKLGVKKVPIWLSLVVLAVYALLVTKLPSIASFLGAETVSATARMGGKSERLLMMQQALQISTTYPWFGAGWYEFGPQQIRISADFPAVGYSQHAHNIVLNFAAELGWPVTVIFFTVLAYWLFRVWFGRPINEETAFVLLVFMSVFVHSLVEYPLWHAYILIPIALLIGMVHQQQFESSFIPISKTTILPVLAVMLVSTVAIATDYRRLVSGMWVTGWGTLGVKIDAFDIQRPRVTIFPHFYDYFEAKKLKIRVGMPAEEIELMERVAKRFGYLDSLERMALAYTANGKPEDGLRILIAISKLHEHRYPDVYNNWKHFAAREPALFGDVFNRMPKPVHSDSLTIQ